MCNSRAHRCKAQGRRGATVGRHESARFRDTKIAGVQKCNGRAHRFKGARVAGVQQWGGTRVQCVRTQIARVQVCNSRAHRCKGAGVQQWGGTRVQGVRTQDCRMCEGRRILGRRVTRGGPEGGLSGGSSDQQAATAGLAVVS
jgi:hypothetical protein